MVVGLFLSVVRIVLLVVLSIFDIARVDRSMFPYLRTRDTGYMGFYGQLLLQEGFGRYFQTSRDDEEYLKQLDKAEREKNKKGGMPCCGASAVKEGEGDAADKA